jgi:nucleoporin NDC1
VLQSRLQRIYVLDLLATHLVLCALLLTSPASLLAPVRPTLALLSLAVFLFAVLPLIVLRKWAVSRPTAPPAPLKVLGFSPAPGSLTAHCAAVLRARVSWHRILAHTASGVLLAAAHVAALWLYTPGASSPWAPYTHVAVGAGAASTAVLRPNERVFLVLAINAALGAAYSAARLLHAARAGPPFEPASLHYTLAARLGIALRTRLPGAVAFGAALPSALLAIYVPLRRPLFRTLLRIIGPHSSLRPVLIPSFRTPFVSGVPALALHLSSLGAASAVCWELAACLWDTYASQPVLVSHFAREPTRCLIAGLAAGQPDSVKADPTQAYYAHFAFAELASLCSTSDERRAAIWRDVGDVGPLASVSQKPSAWVGIATECIRALKEETEVLARRGAPPAAPAQPAKPAEAQKGGLPKATHNVLVADPSKKVVKPAPTSVWDRLLASSAPAAPPAPQPSASSTATDSTSGLSQLMHRIAPKPVEQEPTAAPASSTAPPKPAAPPACTSSDAVRQVLVACGSAAQRLKSLLPPPIRQTLDAVIPSGSLSPSDTLVLGTLAPAKPALSLWAAQAVTGLLSASVAEDEYGTVALARGTAGAEEVLLACAKLLLELNQWHRSAESAASARDEAEKKARAAAAQSASDGGKLPQAPLAAVGAHKAALAEAWKREALPLANTLRTGILQVRAAFEPHDLGLSAATRGTLEQALVG